MSPKIYIKLLFFITSLVFITTTINYYFSAQSQGDEAHYLVINQTIRDYKSLDVGKSYSSKNYNSFFPGTLAPHFLTNQKGEQLPTHGIGGPFIWHFFYIILGRLGVMLFITAVSILTILNIYKIFEEFRIKGYIAFLLSISFAISSSIFLFSHLTFIEPISMLIVSYVFLKIIQEKILRNVDLLLVGTSVGLLHWLHLRFLAVEIPLALFLILKLIHYSKQKTFLLKAKQQIKPVIFFLVPLFISFMIYELYYYFVWGSINPLVSLNGQGSPKEIPWKGLIGIFFDRQFGIFFTSPIFILLPAGIFTLLKRGHKRILFTLLMIITPYIILFTSVGPAWGGGWSPPARYLLSVIPILSILVGVALVQFDNKLNRFIFYFLVAWGFLYNQLSLFSAAHGFNGEGSGTNQTYNFIRDYILHHKIDPNKFLPSLYEPINFKVLVTWVLVVILINLLFIYSKQISKICLQLAKKSPLSFNLKER